jgi:ketosteroid isomerase-like protein
MCLAVLLAARGAVPPEADSTAEDLAAIAAFNERYLAAINNEDIAALSALTTDGHIMLMPNRPPLVGKGANDAANRRAFEQFDFNEWRPLVFYRAEKHKGVH